MNIIKAKPGVFKGIQYRSRLEILWAAFFDQFGIEFDYEPERFELKLGSYLPDFYLKNVTYVEHKHHGSSPEGLWFEVKNPVLCTKEVEKGYLRGDFDRVRCVDEYSDPVRLMQSLVDHIFKTDPFPGLDFTPGTVVWFTPSDMYLGLQGYSGDITNRVLDEFESIVLNPFDDGWPAHQAFWKCPECNTISFSVGGHRPDSTRWLEEYGLKHTDTCKYNTASLPGLKSLQNYAEGINGDTLPLIDGNLVYYNYTHEVIGKAA